jgi:hypothetical protein
VLRPTSWAKHNPKFPTEREKEEEHEEGRGWRVETTKGTVAHDQTFRIAYPAIYKSFYPSYYLIL